jgi:hypothetical protein
MKIKVPRNFIAFNTKKLSIDVGEKIAAFPISWAFCFLYKKNNYIPIKLYHFILKRGQGGRGYWPRLPLEANFYITSKLQVLHKPTPWPRTSYKREINLKSYIYIISSQKKTSPASPDFVSVATLSNLGLSVIIGHHSTDWAVRTGHQEFLPESVWKCYYLSRNGTIDSGTFHFPQPRY